MHSLKTVSLAGLLVMSAACATTFFTSTWVNPGTRPVALTGQKIVALMVTGDDTNRRSAEDALARQITARGGQGIAAWTIISTADVQNEEKTRAAMTGAGAVAIVTMEIVDQRREIDPVNFRTSVSTSRRSFWGNYHWAWRTSWVPPPQTRTNVWIETLVYLARTGRTPLGRTQPDREPEQRCRLVRGSGGRGRRGDAANRPAEAPCPVTAERF